MIQVAFDADQLLVDLTNAPRVTTLQLQKWLTLFLARLHSSVIKNIGPGGYVGRRSGNLARSIRDRVTVLSSGTLVGEVGPDPSKAVYGEIQEHGGTIIPRRSRYLTIPLRAMLTGNGVARGSARDVISNPAGFGFTGTFFHNSVLFGKVAGGSIIPLFALKSSVSLEAKRYLEQTLQQELPWGVQKLQEITNETAQLIFRS